eukprot:TRINITY_DN62931_c0_g1_i1.p1 TRINITY_DN62931_c0_g1~~TRINITY_DN62931_c0_g1_i1.p1  ORF type:complete len:687 (-),score=30.74 TRINITY_DN62931_c0_g1_i1:96-2156(-)
MSKRRRSSQLEEGVPKRGRSQSARGRSACDLSSLKAYLQGIGGECDITSLAGRFPGFKKDFLKEHFHVRRDRHSHIVSLKKPTSTRHGRKDDTAKGPEKVEPSSCRRTSMSRRASEGSTTAAGFDDPHSLSIPQSGRHRRSRSRTDSGLASELPSGEKICYKFNNRDDSCRGSCGMQHKCQVCFGSHPKFKCSSRRRRASPTPAASRRRSASFEKVPMHTDNMQELQAPRRTHSTSKQRSRGDSDRGRSRSHRRHGSERHGSSSEDPKLDEVCLLGRLVLKLRAGTVDSFCELARETAVREGGFLCANGVLARLRAEVEAHVNSERTRLSAMCAIFAETLNVQSNSLPSAPRSVSRLSPAQRLRADVLARHVARLGSFGKALEATVLRVTQHDERWRIRGEEYEASKSHACKLFEHGARPSADQQVRDELGVGGAGGGLHAVEGEPLEAGGEEPNTMRRGRPTQLPVRAVYFSHGRISETFREADAGSGSILELAISLLSGLVDPSSLPRFQVIYHRHKWHLATGHRRMAALRLASFFDPTLQKVRVDISDDLNRFLTGAGIGNPTLSTQTNASNCDGRWVCTFETGEVIGRRMTLDTYGCDLLWLMYTPDEKLPESSSKDKAYLTWRTHLTTALAEAGQPAQDVARRAAKSFARKSGFKFSKQLQHEAATAIPLLWQEGDYVWAP